MFLINGRPSDSIPASDRGLHYGDGLFETLAVRAGTALCWERHQRRLFAGCARLGIPAPDADLLRDEVRRFADGVERGVIKLTLTRGGGGRGYRPPARAIPTRILAQHPWPDYPPRFARDGVHLRTCHTRLGINPALAGIKHLNRLEQVLARAEWDDPEIPEGLMLDSDGRVIEGTMSNLFLVRGDSLTTPGVERAGVSGIMRELVLEAGAALAPVVATVMPDELLSADEVFLCNSLIGIWPVRRIDDREVATGPVAHRLRDRLASRGVLG